MLITREQVQERIAQYEKEIEQMSVTLQAYDGALQDAKFWLSVLDKEELTSGNADQE